MANTNSVDETTLPYENSLQTAYFRAFVLPNGPYLQTLTNEQLVDRNEPLVIQSIEIHSSIFGLYRYAVIDVLDSIGQRELTSLGANDLIVIEYSGGVPMTDNIAGMKRLYFNIYDIKEIPIDENSIRIRFTQKMLKIHLIEAPFFLAYNKNYCNRTWGKSYGDGSISGVSIGNIIEDHLKNDLGIHPQLVEYNFDKMSTSIHFCCPYWKTQTMINYLLTACKDQYNFSNVVLFNTDNIKDMKTVVNLKSVNSLYKQEKEVEYTFIDSSSMVSSVNNKFKPSQDRNTILSWEINTYDLTTLTTGIAGGTVVGSSYDESLYYEARSTYTNSTNLDKFSGNYATWKQEISDFRNKLYSPRYIDNGRQIDFINNRIENKKYQIEIDALMYINENRNVGDKVNLVFPSILAVHEQHILDEQFTGTFIIKEIIDICTITEGFSKVKLIGDSFFNLMSPNNGGGAKKLPKVKPISEYKGTSR